MDLKKEKEFFDRFNFISTSGDPMKDSMVWGFACENGWFDLLWDLCLDLEIMNKENLKTIDKDIIAKSILENGYNAYSLRVTQVKEKYGTLSFYTSGATEEMWRRIKEATTKSSEICEMCGKPGTIERSNGWFSTRCKECREKDGKNRLL